MIHYKQLQDFNAIDYLQSLWTKALCCGPLYGGYRLTGISIQGVRWSIRQKMSSHRWRSREYPFKNSPEIFCHWRSSNGKIVLRKAETRVQTWVLWESCINVESASSLEKLFLASSDSKVDSKLLAVSQALKAAMRPTTDLASTVSMESVNYCWVCLGSTHGTSKDPPNTWCQCIYP